MAAATATVLVGGSTIEQRRLLQLADAGRGGRPERAAYVETAARLVRALTIDGGVGQAVLDGRRAVALAEAGADEILTAALAAYARALFFAGELDEAWAVALRTLEHPAIERHVPSLVVARSTLALVAVERGRLASARGHAEKAKAAVGRIGTSRSWLGANASAALGSVLAAEGSLVEAEHELAVRGTLLPRRGGDAAPHVAARPARPRPSAPRPSRRSRGDAALRAPGARRAQRQRARCPRSPTRWSESSRPRERRASSGEVLEPPSEAELAVLRLMATDLSTREIGERLFLSPNTIRSHRRALYHKLGVHSRTDAIARATALGLLEQTESPG